VAIAFAVLGATVASLLLGKRRETAVVIDAEAEPALA
jgi:hypothetical protein